MSYEDCINEIRAAAGDLTDNQIDKVSKTLDDLIKKIKEQDPDNMEASLRSAVAADATEKEIVAMLNMRNAALNISAENKAFEYIVTNWAGEYAEGYKALLEGTNVSRVGARESVGKHQDALSIRYYNALSSELDKAGVRTEIISGAFDLEMRQVTDAMGKSDTPDLSAFSDIAIKGAKVLHDVSEMARLRANAAGAWIKKLPGWMHKTRHDAGNIKSLGEEGWINLVKENLDWAKTMPDLPVNKMGNELKKMYSQFVASYHPLVGGESNGSHLSGNPAGRLGKERVLIWKSPEAEHAYFQAINGGTIIDSVSMGLDQIARDTALMEKLGPNAEGVLNNIENKIGSSLTSNVEQLDRFAKVARRMKTTVWPNITGEVRIPGSQLLAQVGQGARDVQTWAHLSHAVFSQIADVATAASELAWQESGSFFKGIFNHITDALRFQTRESKMWAAAELGVVFEGITPHSGNLFNALDGVPGKMSWMAQMTYRLNLNHWLSDKVRLGFARSMAYRFGSDHATHVWADLNPETQRLLSLYNIDSTKWEILRKAIGEGDDGRIYLLPERIDDLPDSNFEAAIVASGKTATKRRIANFRRELKDSLKTMYFDRATYAVIHPDIQTRSTMNQGTQVGTIPGESARSIGQFKSFVAALMQRTYGREIFGRSSNVPHGPMEATKQLFSNRNGELVGFSQTMVASIAFGYVALTLSELAKGRMPRSPETKEEYYQLFMSSLAKGGAGGIYGDFLSGTMRNSMGGTPVDTLLGPVVGDFNSVFDIIGRLKTGDDASAQALRVIYSNAPNLFWTKWATDYLILYRLQEIANPGYLSRMEDRVKKDRQNQEYIIPPSSFIGYGG